MVKRDKNAHQSNYYKATHSSGGKGSKKSGGKGGKGNKSINKFLGIGKPGPHLLKHKQAQEAKKQKRQQHNNQNGKSGKGGKGANNNQSKDNRNDRNLRSSKNKGTTHHRHHHQNPGQTWQDPHDYFDNMEQGSESPPSGHLKLEHPQKPKPQQPSIPVAQQKKRLPWEGDHDYEKDLQYDYYALKGTTPTGGPPLPPTEGPGSVSLHVKKLIVEQRTRLQKKIAEDPTSVPPPAPLDPRMMKERARELRKEEERANKRVLAAEKEEARLQRKEARLNAPPEDPSIKPATDQDKGAKKKAAKKKRKAAKALAKAESKEQRKQERIASKGRPRDSLADQIMSERRKAESEKRLHLLQQLTDQGEDKAPKSPVLDPQGRDEMQRGDDFIEFDMSDEEKVVRPSSSASSVQVISQQEFEAAADGMMEGHGQKRKRSPDYGSDTEGSTGPPANCPWMGHRQYSKMPSVSLMLTQEVKDFVDYISPTREEHQVRKYVFQRVEETIQMLWPDAKVVIFGSYDTQLYLPSSDLDVVVLRQREFVRNDYYRLSEHLRSTKVGQEITTIAKARVPIVKFKEAISGLPVDISFNITNGIESAMIVKEYMDTCPALRPLTMAIKHFLMIKGHNEVFQGGIGSYTTMIMILSFLQMHPQVQTGMINPEDNLGVLLIEFFELYGLCYNYNKVGLTVMNGGAYFEKPPPKVTHRVGEMLLCSIDPNDADNDTAKGSYMLRKIREIFVGAYGTLTASVQERHRTLFGNRKGNGAGGGDKGTGHYRFDEHNRVPADSVGKSSALHHKTQVSLIKDILSVPFHVMEQRRHMESVFYQGQFQKMFGDPKGITGLDKIMSLM